MRYQSATIADSPAGILRLASLITIAVLLADVASKNWALAAVGTGHVDLGFIVLTVVENEALAFSTGTGVLSGATVLGLRLAALFAILLLAWRFGADSVRYAVGFALVIGGGLGNASDVVFRDGAVVDFISPTAISSALGAPSPAEGLVLNLADVWIFIGLALLYPLFRQFGRAAQQRMEEVEDRVLGL
jgi:lipoprotein signal peptidase